MITRIGYHLHPKITQVLRDSDSPLQILDLATGNGIWATELAWEQPQHHITGLDISSEQFPPKLTWPKNTSFGTYDVFAEVPAEYITKFDVIHVRYIMAVLWQSPDRRVTALNNMKRMLKPGGWLQWQEAPPPTFAYFSSPGSDGLCEFTNGWPEFLGVVENYFPIQSKSDYMNRLDTLVRENGGFYDVEAIWPKMRPDRAKYEADLLRWNWLESKAGLYQAPGLSEEGKQEMEEASVRFDRRLQSGEERVGMRNIVVVARKDR